MPINVTVKLFASLRQGRFTEGAISIESGSVVSDIIGRLNIQEKDLAVALVNGKNKELDQPLADGDIISLFPLVGGG